jgi:hypothetical protein
LVEITWLLKEVVTVLSSMRGDLLDHQRLVEVVLTDLRDLHVQLDDHVT